MTLHYPPPLAIMFPLTFRFFFAFSSFFLWWPTTCLWRTLRMNIGNGDGISSSVLLERTGLILTQGPYNTKGKKKNVTNKKKKDFFYMVKSRTFCLNPHGWTVSMRHPPPSFKIYTNFYYSWWEKEREKEVRKKIVENDDRKLTCEVRLDARYAFSLRSDLFNKQLQSVGQYWQQLLPIFPPFRSWLRLGTSLQSRREWKYSHWGFFFC